MTTNTTASAIVSAKKRRMPCAAGTARKVEKPATSSINATM
jgi:hypothetical protein